MDQTNPNQLLYGNYICWIFRLDSCALMSKWIFHSEEAHQIKLVLQHKNKLLKLTYKLLSMIIESRNQRASNFVSIFVYRMHHLLSHGTHYLYTAVCGWHWILHKGYCLTFDAPRFSMAPILLPSQQTVQLNSNSPTSANQQRNTSTVPNHVQNSCLQQTIMCPQHISHHPVPNSFIKLKPQPIINHFSF